MNHREEKELIEAIIGGDRGAEEALIQRFKRGLIWLGRRKVASDLAEDIVQETFVNFFKSLRKGLPEKPLSLQNYIYGIFKKVVADYITKKKKNEIMVVKENGSGGIETRTPESEYIKRERINFLSEYIHSLPWRYREIIILHYLEGYSVKEISTLMKLPIGTVCYRLHEGRKKIAKKANKKSLFKDLLYRGKK